MNTDQTRMFHSHHRITNNLPGAVQRPADKASFRNLHHAAASTRKEMIASIKDAPASGGTQGRSGSGRFTAIKRTRTGSPPGSPPYTRKGRKIKRAILYNVDRQRNAKRAVVGTARTRFGTAGEPHEHGGRYKGQTFAERPFAYPAMVRQAPRFAGSFAGSIGS